ncbi:MAG: Gfo/Idh/MocA family oxidoreductase [Ginsengibacter sp.]
MDKIKWGIIGCGNVTEMKSGPAFNKVANSSLVAVMRRDAEKAKDYAQRHHVARWYSDANKLIDDPEVNAIYIATPPSSHEEYTLAAINAGKPVYVEKPMSASFSAAGNMLKAVKENNAKLVVAHYRREQPLFKKVKQLLNEKVIGEVRVVNLSCYKNLLSAEELNDPKVAWRVNREIAGGGLFHDLAPHQLDLMLNFFGEVKRAFGVSTNQAKLYEADDIVSGTILFKSGVVFNGSWCFSVNDNDEKDLCEIIGSGGKISFPVFEHKQITLVVDDKVEIIPFEKLEHVQQPLIAKVVEYFLDQSPNPCSAEAGVEVMRLMEEFTKK